MLICTTMAANNNRIVIGLGVLLAIVVVAGLAVFFALPGEQEQSQPTGTTTAGQQFDFDFLQQQEFLQIDRELINQGLLPVRPPAETGKANPFI